MTTLHEAALDRTAELRLDQAYKLNDLATTMAVEGSPQLSTAIVMLRRAIRLAPDLPEIHSNLGLFLFRAGEYAESEQWLRSAVAMDPTNAAYRGNLGTMLSAMGDPYAAAFHLGEAIGLSDTNHGATWDLALVQLKSGHLDRGFELYESRIPHRGPGLYPKFPVPMWQGEDLNGKTIYVQGEQGIGDRILFSRYLALLRQRYPQARILTCMTETLSNLFWFFQSHGVEILPNGIPWPQGIDYGAWLCSLPRFLGAKTLQDVPPDPGWIKERLDAEATRCRVPTADLPSLKVGICWTGSPSMARNQDRSVPLELMLKLGEDPRVQLYSFQCGAGHQGFIASGAGAIVVDLGPDLEKEGLVGTGLALREMDLVITVCTSVAHLAGALGVPCWTLLCADPYWIWGTEGATTPWYPHMRLFRQKSLGEWHPVIDKVQQALTALLEKKDL